MGKLTKTDNQILVKMGLFVLHNPEFGISKERFAELNGGLAFPDMEEVDLLTDLIVDELEFSEDEAADFLDRWVVDAIEEPKTSSTSDKSGLASEEKSRFDDIFSEFDFTDEVVNDAAVNNEQNNEQKFSDKELDSLLAGANSHDDNLRLISLYQDALKREDDVQMRAISNRIVEINVGLIYKVVRKYAGRFSSNSTDEDDMFVFGAQGMLKAIERFDFSQDTQFSTYAMWWLRQSIMRGIYDEASLIRVPVHMQEKISKMNQIKRQKLINGQDITAKDIANEMNITEKQATELLIFDQQYSQIISLDMPIQTNEGGETTIGDIANVSYIYDSSESPDAFELIAESEFLASLSEALNDRELSVIVRRFGLNGDKRQTLEEIGEVMGVTRERIRQIEAKALQRLKTNIYENKWVERVSNE